jgi:hypothetical protein
MQGNPAANNVKWGLRALSVVLIPLTASFPQVWLRLNWNALRLKATPRSVPALMCSLRLFTRRVCSSTGSRPTRIRSSKRWVRSHSTSPA